MAFMLRIRLDDQSEWGPPEAYRTRKSRDKVAAFNRIIGGLRTHSWTESKGERQRRELAESGSAVDPSSET